jgi:hypothetical protein
MTSRRKRALPIALLALITLLGSTPAQAGDKSFSSVVKHIKSNYGAKQQGFYGAMMFARFVVKVVRPAGVKNFKVALLKDLNLSERPDRTEFHEATRRLIGNEWQPLVQFNSSRANQYTHVYVQHSKSDVKLLVVTLQRNEAVVAQTKFSPEKLIKFIDDPKIMGISLKDKKDDDPAGKPADGPEAPANPDQDEKKPAKSGD